VLKLGDENGDGFQFIKAVDRKYIREKDLITQIESIRIVDIELGKSDVTNDDVIIEYIKPLYEI
jgi:hypothetical protein